MPKVKYLKDLCSGQAGDVRDLQDYEVAILLTLGVIELFDEQFEPKKEADQVLKNLNGTDVVDNFGNLAMIVVKSKPVVVSPKTEVKTGKKGR